MADRGSLGNSYILPPTDDAYIVACKKRGVEPHSLVLEDGTRAHWIGEEGAEKLIVNFHGSSYSLSLPHKYGKGSRKDFVADMRCSK